jgi:murein DD-endopeptidase MepM/ murein hydrolase activator NlpD
MRHPMKSSNVRLLGRVAAVALLAGTAAGCSSDVTRFGSNLFEPTDNQSQIVTGSVNPAPAVQQPAAMPAYATPAVSSQPLPPTPGAVVSNQPFVRHDTQVAAAPVQPVADPAVQPATQPLSGSPGWSAAGGTPVTVRPGETVQTISRRYGVPESAILAANGLPKGGALQPGSQVVIPVYSYGQSQTAAAKPAGTRPAGQLAQMPATGGNVYVVKPGDSLGKIANSYGMKSTQLAAANGIDATKPIKIGQKLRIPAAQPAGQQVAALNPGTMNDASPVAPKPAALPPKAPVQAPVSQANGQVPGTPAPAAPAAPAQNTQTASLQPTPVKPQVQAPSVAETSAPAAGNFRWPVRGRVISAYGVKANGERNDGINIEVPEGTPIKAAEGGEVIYAGNELKGYGNLVLVKHPNGYVSAYAHASEILVQRGDTIMRGQTLGKVGATGNVARPQLHFEIRNGNRPVDPLPHLSG